MKRFIHPEDIESMEWQTFSQPEWGPLRWKDLHSRELNGSKEFTFGIAELPEGGELPLHRHYHAQHNYILSGKVNARLGSHSVELNEGCPYYFPAGGPHSLQNIGTEPLRYLYWFATQRLGSDIQSLFVSEDDDEARRVFYNNIINDRWCLSANFEEWHPTETTKDRGFIYRTFFDANHGKSNEIQWGDGKIIPKLHYSLHLHSTPEIFYYLKGDAIFYIEDTDIGKGIKEHKISPGSNVYLPGNAPHAKDNTGTEDIHFLWIYATEVESQELGWWPLEDIRSDIRR